MNLTIKELSDKVGGLSNTNKMPGFSYGLSASKCVVGSLLRKKAGSVCACCYAHKGLYSFPYVKTAHENRFKSLSDPKWVENMTELISKKYRNKTGKDRVFRWHDSGDIQSVAHLGMIVEVSNALDTIKFWIPTREAKIVSEWRAIYGSFPTNLTVRISAPMVGSVLESNSFPTSAVNAPKSAKAFNCGAYKRDGKCGPCRKCWDPKVTLISYPKH